MSLEIDHIVVCVSDIAEAAREFEDEHGVTAIAGGRHVGHGTANMIIPLGPNYIELLTVVDPREAVTSPLGTWALHRAAVPGGDGLCLRTDDLDGIARRLGAPRLDMSRVTPDGVILSWSIVGLKQALSSNLPFFIAWDVPVDLHPGRTPITHPGGDVRLSDVTIWGDPTYLREWAPDPSGVEYAEGDGGVSFRLAAD